MTRRRLSCLVASAVVGAALLAWPSSEAAHAEADEEPPPRPDYSAEDLRPGTAPTGAGNTGINGGPTEQAGGAPVPEVCLPEGRTAASVDSGDAEKFPLLVQIAGPRPSPDARLVLSYCGGEWDGGVGWNVPGQPAAPATPPPEDLAWLVYVRLEGTLPPPVLASDPAAGTAAIVRKPTFVQVTNWTGTVTDQECFLDLCVSVTAEPSLTFSPGEQGAADVACAGSGSRFDSAGGLSEVQAAEPGACAYAYQRRTGVEGRPEEWSGRVTVTWRLSWSSTSGRTGSLPDVAKSADLPRAVHEVQVVVR